MGKKKRGTQKDDGPASVVLNMNLCCDGCVRKIKLAVGRLEGVEAVEADVARHKLTVTGKVNPAKLRDTVAKKTKKKVVLGKENLLYEVFLSFRGGDTRTSFTSHLNASLQNAGINVFRDDDSLERGDNISSSLQRAIEQSQISIIIFSKNYANSRWCMDELLKIMKCHRTIGQVVLPVFYDVDPSGVRRQRGEFGKAFQSLFNRISKKEGRYNVFGKALGNLFNKMSIGKDESLNQVLSWRSALREASSLAGFVVPNSR